MLLKIARATQKSHFQGRGGCDHGQPDGQLDDIAE